MRYEFGPPPILVRESYTNHYPESKIGPVEKVTRRDGTVYWRVQLKTKDGQQKILDYDKDGKLMSEE